MSIVNIAITCILYFCIMTVIAFTPVESAPKPEPVPDTVSGQWFLVSNYNIEGIKQIDLTKPGIFTIVCLFPIKIKSANYNQNISEVIKS